MNDDLISRQAAIDAFEKELTVGESKGNYVTICSAVGYEGAKQILERLPSAERKKGRWIPVDSYTAYGGDEATWMSHGNPIAFYYCSECKGQAYAGEDGESLLTDFCPNCGAKMERGEQE